MKLPRPYIPKAVRLEVANQQAIELGLIKNKSADLAQLLYLLFGNARVNLDHNPPLAFRMKAYGHGGKFLHYIPDANDPNYLLYRTEEDHKLKTNVRGIGAQYPDRVLIKKIRRIERPRKKRKYNWPKRSFSRKVKR